MTPRFAVSTTALDSTALQALVSAPEHGALVIFAGVARNNFAGRATAFLEYEAFEPMAIQIFEQLAAEAQQRFAVGSVAIHHRVGTLKIGETAVIIAVGSAHRQAAFSAAAYIMDRIKEVAPIWKCEHWADGTAEWIGAEHTRPH